MRRQRKRVRDDKQRLPLVRAIKCYPHLEREIKSELLAAVPRSFFVWGLAMSSWLRTFPFMYAPSSIAIRDVEMSPTRMADLFRSTRSRLYRFPSTRPRTTICGA